MVIETQDSNLTKLEKESQKNPDSNKNFVE